MLVAWVLAETITNSNEKALQKRINPPTFEILAKMSRKELGKMDMDYCDHADMAYILIQKIKEIEDDNQTHINEQEIKSN